MKKPLLHAFLRHEWRRLQDAGTSGTLPLAPAATSYGVTSSNDAPVAGDPVTITAQLLDQSGNPFAAAGHVVTWTKSNAGGSFATATSTTNGSGIATVVFTTSGTVAVSTTVTATDAGALTGTSETVTTHSAAPVATSYAVSSSNDTPTAGAPVTITAQVLDQFSSPLAVAGRVVTWSKSHTGGSFASPTSTTNSSGIATVVFTTIATPSTATTVTATDAGSITGTSETITTAAGGTADALIQALIDGELDGGQVDLYSGTAPRSTLNAASGVTLLASFPFDTPAAPAGNLLASNQITLNLETSFVFSADSGTTKFARVRRSDGSVLADVTVGLSGSGAALIISSNTVTIGQLLTITLRATA